MLQSERSALETMQRLEGILASAMDAIITVNDQQRVVVFNPAAERMFGLPSSEALGEHISRFIPLRHHAAHAEHIQRFIETGDTNRQMGSLGAVSGLRASGEEFPIEASISQAQVGGERLGTVILRDITERRANEEARDLLAREVDHRAKNALAVVQAVSGNAGWTINPMSGNTKAIALPEDAVKSLANETDLTGLYNYKVKGYKVTLDGEEELSGAKVYKVSMTLPSGVRRINYISKDTFYILKIVAHTTINGQDIMSENVQSDFRAVDGIYYPFASEVTTSAMPGTKMGLKITALEVNPQIDPKIFEMPQ